MVEMREGGAREEGKKRGKSVYLRGGGKEEVTTHPKKLVKLINELPM
jgi:hypothetical protein